MSVRAKRHQETRRKKTTRKRRKQKKLGTNFQLGPYRNRIMIFSQITQIKTFG